MKKILLLIALAIFGVGGFLEAQAQAINNSQLSNKNNKNNFIAEFIYKGKECPPPSSTKILAKIEKDCLFNTDLEISLAGEGIDKNVEVMLVMDRSGSMAEKKIVEARKALKIFLGLLEDRQDKRNRAGLITFASTVTLDSSLTSNYDVLKTAIDNMQALGGTDVGDALSLANRQLGDPSEKEKIIILASDGMHNVGTPPSNIIGKIYSDVTVYTVGMGKVRGGRHDGIDEETLKNIANNSGTKKGKYYRAEATNLKEVYQKIFEDIFQPFEAKNIEIEFYLADDALGKVERRSINPIENSFIGDAIRWKIREAMKTEDSKNFQMKFLQNSAGKYFFNKAFIKVNYESFGKEYEEILSINQLEINSGNCTGPVPDEHARVCEENLAPPRDMPNELVQNCRDYSGLDKACKYECQVPYEYYDGKCVIHGRCPSDLPDYTCDFSYEPTSCLTGDPEPFLKASFNSDAREFYWECEGIEGGDDEKCTIEKRTCTSDWIEVAF